MRTGNNIRQRKDGRFEARYEKGRDSNGHIVYGYVYAASYEEAEAKRAGITGFETKTKQMNLLILGYGDHGKEVRDLVQKFRIFNKICFLDDNKVGQENVLGPCADFKKYVVEFPVAIAAVGDSSLRCKWMNELIKAGFIIPTFIDSTAVVPANAKIGIGTVICANATVGSEANIGQGCIIDCGSIVSRHANVPDWTLVNCGEIYKQEEK